MIMYAPTGGQELKRMITPQSSSVSTESKSPSGASDAVGASRYIGSDQADDAGARSVEPETMHEDPAAANTDAGASVNAQRRNHPCSWFFMAEL